MGLKIAVYCRVSTDTEQQLNSLENQKQLFQSKIESDGDELYRVFFDEGLTGTKLNNRKGFHEMLILGGIDVVETVDKKLLSNGNFDTRIKRKITNYIVSERKPCFDKIYIKNTSRFARNTLSYDIICKLREKGVSVYFLEQNIDTSDYSRDFLLQMFQVFDQNDSRDKSIKTLTGIKKSAERGVIRTNKKIYGFKYSKDTNSLTLIPSESETIRRIYSLYLEGLGIRRIQDVLEKEGRFTREGKPFCKTAIKRILSNEKYYGGLAILKWDTGRVFEKYSYPQLKEEYEVIISDRIEPIISKEIFDSVQEIMRSKSGDGVGRYNGTSKFSGKVFCLHCGNRYVSDKDKRSDGSSYEFFRCYGKKENGVEFCSSSNVSKEYLETKLQSDIQNKKLEHIYELGIKSLEQQIEHISVIYSSDTKKEKEVLETRLSELKNEIKFSFKEFANGRLIEEIYSSIVEENNREIESINKRLIEIEAPEKAFNERRDVLLTRIHSFRQRLLKGLSEEDYLKVLHISVSHNGTPYFQYNVPEFNDEVSNLFRVINEKHGTGKCTTT